MPEVFVPSLAGRLEAKFNKSRRREAPMAIFLHAHPLFGGNMDNQITYQLYWALQNADYSVIRFNFRGVNNSEGAFSNGEGELCDANVVLDWMLDEVGITPVTVVGFSFGAWVGANLVARRPEVSHFVAIAPPSNYYDFAFMTEFCPASSLFVSAQRDAIVPRGAIDDLLFAVRAQNDHGQFTHVEIPEANHFFEGKIPEVVKLVTAYLERSK